MYCIGYDIGSSSVKATIIDQDSGRKIAIVSYPDTEMSIHAPQQGWAEQDPNMWWESVCIATQLLLRKTSIDPKSIKSIGIAYQMHGLVVLDKNHEVLRPAIIWCDSRAVEIGDLAFCDLGNEYCFDHLLNSPGNFTASKLKWVKKNEPELFDKIRFAMLPGDYIAMRLSGEINTTVSGLSEGMLWDFVNHKVASKLMDYYDISERLLPEIVDIFSIHGKVSFKGAKEVGLAEGTPITYRAGDQPNNAMALRVLNPGEIAATGGTSGVVYGVSDQIKSDQKSRINAFAHVNHSQINIRIGQLLCINGAGSQYAWIKNQMVRDNQSYNEMESEVAKIPIGSEGLKILPFGNGTERMLNNANKGAHFSDVQFNIHRREHFYRAALEGIAFSFVYGIKIMNDLGIAPKKIRVGNDNLFQSRTFANSISTLLGCTIEMMDTTGAIGAAKASRIGLGIFHTPEEAIESTEIVKTYHPDNRKDEFLAAYDNWEATLKKILNLK